jgi:peptide/nickel transport system permease protein
LLRRLLRANPAEHVETVNGEVTIAPRVALRQATSHPIAGLVLRRLAGGVLTLLVVSVIVFFATSVLPGNAAYAILGRTATPARLRALEHALHIDRGFLANYWGWLQSLLLGHFGHSLVNGQPVTAFVGPRIVNSAVLLVLAGVISTLAAGTLGAIAALRRDGMFDHAASAVALVVTALPEFVVAVLLVSVFATNVFHLLPGVSDLPPGTRPWDSPNLVVLPVLTLVLVIMPYLFRMMRGSMIEALESDYVQWARLKGLPVWRVTFVHALPNALAPSIQVVGLNFLYLAGGIVIVESVFSYPGVGQGLVDAVGARDVPVIQFVVLVLAAFYILVNITTDVLVLLVTPRRRLRR